MKQTKCIGLVLSRLGSEYGLSAGAGDQARGAGPGVAGERHQAVENIDPRERSCSGGSGNVAKVNDRPLALRRRDCLGLGELGVSLVLTGHDYNLAVKEKA